MPCGGKCLLTLFNSSVLLYSSPPTSNSYLQVIHSFLSNWSPSSYSSCSTLLYLWLSHKAHHNSNIFVLLLFIIELIHMNIPCYTHTWPRRSFKFASQSFLSLPWRYTPSMTHRIHILSVQPRMAMVWTTPRVHYSSHCWISTLLNSMFKLPFLHPTVATSHFIAPSWLICSPDHLDTSIRTVHISSTGYFERLPFFFRFIIITPMCLSQSALETTFLWATPNVHCSLHRWATTILTSMFGPALTIQWKLYKPAI